MNATDATATPTPQELRPAAKAPLPKADKYIWAIYILILLVSVVELFSASSRDTNFTLFTYGAVVNSCFSSTT